MVNDYPYGYTLRCKIRYWLESNKNGTRMVSQTSNPKTEMLFWNKPKASTYAKFAGCMFLDDEGHVQWTGLTQYTDAAEAEKWLERCRDGLTPLDLQRATAWVTVKKAYEAIRDEARKEASHG
jgi:hypothetical protein